ncbi:MAG: GerMN domain-containing protein [Candidatus Uhrbacteria bacterium]|nr:GerMN domain-containing protein [Candidatus Uhrbacteria bacterium]
MRTSHVMNILLAIMVFVLIALVASLALKDTGPAPAGNNDDTTVETPPVDGPSEDDEIPDDGTDDTSTSSTSGNIVVYEPDPFTFGGENDVVGVPLVVTGKARVFENQFAYRLTDDDGNVLVEGSAMANAPDTGTFGEFTISTSYDEPATSMGVLEVFQYSAMDGSEVDKVTIPVLFADTETMSVNAYFTTAATSTDCSTVTAVARRIPVTLATARAAVEELLKGPSSNEFNDGYGTSIPLGTTLRSLSIEGGVATVEFNSALDAMVSGSCNVSVIRSQIESTLKQFSSVTSVVILVEGKDADEVLQP